MAQWLWQSSFWPNFSWQTEQVQPVLARCQLQLGKLSGLAYAEPAALPTLDTLLANILTSSAIEGEMLNAQSVRSSLLISWALRMKPVTLGRNAQRVWRLYYWML